MAWTPLADLPRIEDSDVIGRLTDIMDYEDEEEGEVGGCDTAYSRGGERRLGYVRKDEA